MVTNSIEIQPVSKLKLVGLALLEGAYSILQGMDSIFGSLAISSSRDYEIEVQNLHRRSRQLLENSKHWQSAFSIADEQKAFMAYMKARYTGQLLFFLFCMTAMISTVLLINRVPEWLLTLLATSPMLGFVLVGFLATKFKVSQ